MGDEGCNQSTLTVQVSSALHDLPAGVLDQRVDDGGAWPQVGYVLSHQVQRAIGVFEEAQQQHGHFAGKRLAVLRLGRRDARARCGQRSPHWASQLAPARRASRPEWP